MRASGVQRIKILQNTKMEAGVARRRNHLYIIQTIYSITGMQPIPNWLVKQLDHYDLIVKIITNGITDLHGTQNRRGILYYLLCCFNLKITL